MEKQTKSLVVKHNFNEDELQVLQKRLALQTQTLRHKEKAKKAIVAQLNSEIETIDGELNTLADKINSGYEYREMECLLEYDWDKNKKYALHPETREVVGTYEITDEDHQLKLM